MDQSIVWLLLILAPNSDHCYDASEEEMQAKHDGEFKL